MPKLSSCREDSDQTGRMPRLIWGFAGRTVILLVLSYAKVMSVWHHNKPNLATSTDWAKHQFNCYSDSWSWLWVPEKACASHVTRKPGLPYVNKKGADQPAHPRSLISTFVDRYLNSSIIPILAKSKISTLYLASVAAQAGLSVPWLQTPKTGLIIFTFVCNPLDKPINLQQSITSWAAHFDWKRASLTCPRN